MGLSAGTVLGPYEIVAPLGRGGMGEVYEARDTRLDRLVAVKVLPDDAAADPHRRERFRREARAVSCLTHHYICSLYDVGEYDGVDFLVMELLAGETLAHRLLRGPLPLKDVVRIGAQLADALDHAHREGIVHRDLKPANVMLTETGAKVLDFGLAKWQDGVADPDARLSTPQATAPSTLTRSGSLVGTIPYMAPEQLEGKLVDARTDLFALGAIIYEMTTGAKAFDGSNAILAAETLPVRTLRPAVPPGLDRLVGKCLARDPRKRWQTASDLRDEIEWVAAGEHAGPPAPSSHRAVRFALAVVSVACVALAFAAIARRSTPPPPAPTTSFAVLPPDNVTGVELPTISPDGRKLAFIGGTTNGKSSLWVRPLESLTAHAVAEADATAFPFWSPDSQSLAFFSQGELKRVDAGGGLPQIICPVPAGRGGTWSPDGVIVFASSSETALSQVAAGGGAPTPMTTLDRSASERSHRFPQFLSDGRRFIYTVYFNAADQKPVLEVGSRDGHLKQRLTETSFLRSFAVPGYLLFNRDLHGPFLAQPFDEATLALTAEPVPIVDRLVPGSVGGVAQLSVSRNGVLAYQTISADPIDQLTWFDRSGQRQGTVGPPNTLPSGSDSTDIALSPDSTHVAVVRNDRQRHVDDVWVIDTARGSSSPVTFDGTSGDPKWAPDGDRIAFTSNRRGTGNSNLYVTRWNGDRAVEPLLVSDANKYLWDWSRDGAFVLFGLQEGPRAGSNLWLLPLGGRGAPWRYLESDFATAEARFSPDTRWVAYQSNESGRNDVYVQSFPKPGARYQVSVDGGTQPRWRRDGRELFYLASNRALMAAAVTAAPTFAVTSLTKLFTVAGTNVTYEVADGERFLVDEIVRPDQRSPMTVVLNWTPGGKR